MLEEIKKDAGTRMSKSVASLRQELTKIRTGRAHTSLLDHITVEYYGSQVPLNQAANIGANGFMTENGAARVTVRLNGKLIHDDVRLSLRRNKYAAYPEEPLSHIVLQEHGSPVKFRNIWLVENAEAQTDPN